MTTEKPCQLSFRRGNEEKSVSNSEISHPEYRNSHKVIASREMTSDLRLSNCLTMIYL